MPHKTIKAVNISDIEEKFDEQYTSMAYGKKWRPGMEVNPSMIKSFIRQAIKTAFESTRVEENMSCNHDLSYSVERACHERQIKGFNQALSEEHTRQNEFLKE